MYAIEIDITDRASPLFRGISAAIQPQRVGPVVGRSGVNALRRHLFGLNQTRANKLGGSRTNFYAAAARGTHFDIVGDAVVLSINQVGIRQRLLGGTIKPKTAKYLTIPARAEAHGKRASEFTDLIVLWGRNGPFALAIGEKTIVQRAGRKLGTSTYQRLTTQRGMILFWLVKSVTQQADPSVLPDEAALFNSIRPDLTSYINRTIERLRGAPGKN